MTIMGKVLSKFGSKIEKNFPVSLRSTLINKNFTKLEGHFIKIWIHSTLYIQRKNQFTPNKW